MLDQNPNVSEAELSYIPVALSPPARHPNYDTPEGQLFRKALELIEDKQHWCIGWLVRDEGKVHARYCAFGALGMAYNGSPHSTIGYSSAFNSYNHMVDKRSDPVVARVVMALESYCGGDLANYNNAHTHAENMAMWKRCGRDTGWL